MNALKSQSIIDPTSCDVDNDFEEPSKHLYRWDLRTTLVGPKLKNKNSARLGFRVCLILRLLCDEPQSQMSLNRRLYCRTKHPLSLFEKSAGILISGTRNSASSEQPAVL